jgi:hypothetical protein
MIRYKPLWIALVASLCVSGIVLGVKLRAKMEEKKQAIPQLNIKRSTTELINAFMHKNYGSASAQEEESKGIWRGKKLPAEYDAASTDSSRICAQTISKQTQRIFLAVCTTFSTMTRQKPALVDFYMLDNNGDTLTSHAEKQNNPTGVDSRQVGEIEILKLGEDFYGFSLTKTYIVQGYEQTVTRLFTPSADDSDLIKILDIQTRASNVDAGQCDSNKNNYKAEWCTRLKQDILVNASVESIPFYPISIVQKGISKGEPRNHEYTLYFNETTWRYTLPYDLVLNFDF